MNQPNQSDESMIPVFETTHPRTQGSVYLSGHGSEERYSILPLHDEANGVIMSMNCSPLHGKHLLPENLAFCRRLQQGSGGYDYRSLMNTTFGLVPAGRSPATYRLAEVMGAGAIPVVVARDVVLPFREQFDWPSFSLSFAPDQVGSELIRTLRAISPTQLKEMQVKHHGRPCFWFPWQRRQWAHKLRRLIGSRHVILLLEILPFSKRVFYACSRHTYAIKCTHDN